jgi:hypothetical protein
MKEGDGRMAAMGMSDDGKMGIELKASLLNNGTGHHRLVVMDITFRERYRTDKLERDVWLGRHDR